MDLDAYVLSHREQWQRLEELTSHRKLGGADNDELVDLYQRVATHLSVVRTSAPDAALISYLSSILARARLRTVGTRTATWSGVVVEGSCGKEISGTWNNAISNTSHRFVLRKQPGWQ